LFARTVDIYDPKAVARLFKRAQHNPERYQSELYAAFWGDAYRLAYGILGNAQDAEDVAQTALVRALSKLDTLDNPQAAIKWIHRIVGNAALDYRRDEGRRMSGYKHADDDINEIETPAHSPHHLPDELMMRKEVSSIVWNLVNELPEKQRDAVMLYYYAGLATKEIATDTDTTDNAVRALLFRARETLNEQITKIEKTQNISLYSGTAFPLAHVLKEGAGAEVVLPAMIANETKRTFGPDFALMKQQVAAGMGAKQWLVLGVATLSVVTLIGYSLNGSGDDTQVTPMSALSVESKEESRANPARNDKPQQSTEESGLEDTLPFTPSGSGSDDPSPVASEPHHEISDLIIEITDYVPPPAPIPPQEHLRLPEVESYIRFSTIDNEPITWIVTARTQTTITITPIDDLPSTEGIFTSAEQAVILSTTGGTRPTLTLDGTRLNFVFKGGFCYAEPY